ncbi:SLC13 family permease [Fulvivirgaceae bacterium BMA12]|uniref:SLC13 family permease n=1 Tax=Agaribacillus aureus TaxID=3051825 RepID=A0ABT8L610_9BACT|nr:SLC13 family permease [Fulvivirgaceae bacterium BMA12]
MIPTEFQSYFVLFVIFLIFYFIYRDLLRPSISFLFATLTFLVTGILTYQEVLSGVSNDKIASIVILILISAGLRKNYNIERIFDKIFKRARTYRSFLFRMMAQVAAISSLINNAPVVALMTPYVFNWGKRNNVAPSKLLIPLSFATIMGGMITVIGTSTTLLLNGFLSENNILEIQPLDLLILGLMVTVTGIAFLGFIGHRLLPNYVDVIEEFKKNSREYLVETQLTKESNLVNKTIIEAGLRNLNGVYLVEIIRDNELISPVNPEETIQNKDQLIFAGNTNNIVDLVNSDKGLTLPENTDQDRLSEVEVTECVISNNSSLIGKMVRTTDFRNRYDAAVVAIHRGGEKISGKIGDTVLKSGDLLLLYTGDNFKERVDLYRDLFIISSQRKAVKSSAKKYLALAVMSGLIGLLYLFGEMSLFPIVLIIYGTMIGFRMVTVRDIKREIDLNLIAILVFSLAIGQAILKTSAGNLLAGAFINVLEPFGLIAILLGLVAVTGILTSLVGNAGAISIAFPLALSITNNLNVDGMPFYLAIAFAASATFLTPISYQTNLIIYGPGGYNFGDFFKIGLPVTILYLLVAISGIIFLYQDVLL